MWLWDGCNLDGKDLKEWSNLETNVLSIAMYSELYLDNEFEPLDQGATLMSLDRLEISETDERIWV
jgi:hypothetical protein